MTPEGKVVSEIKRMVEGVFCGEVRKCVWVGHNGAPDLFIMLDGIHLWIEVKAPGGKPRAHQSREIGRMRTIGGCAVYVCDSVVAAREAIEKEMTREYLPS